jgi:cell division protein FtsW
MAQARRADRSFFIITLLLTLAGFFIFYSASLGLISRTGAQFNSVALKQLVIMVVGLGAFFVVSKLNYQGWQKHSWLVFLISLILTLLVFVPGLGFEAGGAKRWILIGGMSVQTSEFLKLGYVLYLANWLSRKKDAAQSFREGIVPFMVITAIVGIAMVAQPDMSTLGIMLASGVAMLYVAGAKWKHLGLLALLGIVALGGVIAMKPYTQARIKTFFHPEENQLGSSYQVNQSLIAIGSGGVTGRGFGQSIQKFKYLPEPIGDSIFSVAAEEFGFIGVSLLIAAYGLILYRLIRLANRTRDNYVAYFCLGLAAMLLVQLFINIGMNMGIAPVTGIPLPFISAGGSSMIALLIALGMINNMAVDSR